MKEENGTQDSSGKYTEHLKTLGIISEGATNVIPLVTALQSEVGHAWTAAVGGYFKQGLIPLIFMSWEISPSTKETAISSNLKATGKLLNGHFSVISRSSASKKALVLGSPLNQESPCEEQS